MPRLEQAILAIRRASPLLAAARERAFPPNARRRVASTS